MGWDSVASLERAATDKHELVSGELFAMAGGSREHNIIAGNVVTQLNQPSGRAPAWCTPRT
jgi:hypothetical protein